MTTTNTSGDLARQLHPSAWLGEDVSRRLAALMRQSTALRADLVRLSAELAETLAAAKVSRDTLIQRICDPRGTSPVREVVSERLDLMTVGPLLELWRTIAEDAAVAALGYSSSESRRSRNDPASPSEPA